LPSLDEQKEIMFRLDAVASAEQRQEKAVERLRSLKSGLLQDLLTGKVRVTP
jgi:type I restriction enzyme S subunit